MTQPTTKTTDVKFFRPVTKFSGRVRKLKFKYPHPDLEALADAMDEVVTTDHLVNEDHNAFIDRIMCDLAHFEIPSTKSRAGDIDAKILSMREAVRNLNRDYDFAMRNADIYKGVVPPTWREVRANGNRIIMKLTTSI